MRTRRPKNRWQRRRAGEHRGRPARADVPGQNRRLLRFGPGLALALIASVVVWRADPSHLRPLHPARSHSLAPPITAPAATAAAGARVEPAPPPPPAAPGLDFVLEHRADVGLTAAQARKIGAIDQHWNGQTAPLREALERAAREFQGGMAARNGRGIALQDLQQRAGDMSALSRQVAAARRAEWAEASDHLSAAQRERAEGLWRAKLTGRIGAPRGQ